MHKLLNIFLVIIFLSACGKNESNNETKLSSLVKADFSYTQDLFDCTLNENESLIGLESFFSKNIKEYKKLVKQWCKENPQIDFEEIVSSEHSDSDYEII